MHEKYADKRQTMNGFRLHGRDGARRVVVQHNTIPPVKSTIRPCPLLRAGGVSRTPVVRFLRPVDVFLYRTTVNDDASAVTMTNRVGIGMDAVTDVRLWPHASFKHRQVYRTGRRNATTSVNKGERTKLCDNGERKQMGRSINAVDDAFRRLLRFAFEWNVNLNQ